MKQVIPAILVVVALAACQHEGAPSPAAAPVAAAPAAPATAAPTNDVQRLHLDPATLSACEPGSSVRVNWDASDLAETNDLQVWVVDGGQEKLFVAGGASGTATTGTWSRPGTGFRLKSARTGAIVAETVVGGPPC